MDSTRWVASFFLLLCPSLVELKAGLAGGACTVNILPERGFPARSAPMLPSPSHPSLHYLAGAPTRPHFSPPASLEGLAVGPHECPCGVPPGAALWCCGGQGSPSPPTPAPRKDYDTGPSPRQPVSGPCSSILCSQFCPRGPPSPSGPNPSPPRGTFFDTLCRAPGLERVQPPGRVTLWASGQGCLPPVPKTGSSERLDHPRDRPQGPRQGRSSWKELWCQSFKLSPETT